MKYLIKVWLFTTIISPILVFMIWGVFSDISSLKALLELGTVLVIYILFGLVLSFPVMIFFWIIQMILKNTSLSKNIIKLVLSIYSIGSVWIALYTFDKRFFENEFEDIILVGIYTLTIVFGVWFFKLNEAKKTVHNSSL
ncbi:hypothetical protein HKT18_13550 [Flavobacterium sp. IMCC34852]|uniref:Uncharacterized protein n=1 Tax=Flavobacterium rivulicola TaxID=2732161 RepID=A0A7Y3RB20_9FLAO|nr:hypothetical protein [Flavobacterium sp. IMCC34852]NNT73244.1 hypothetical protein [Flavobacterium sp. IMCC34852]